MNTRIKGLCGAILLLMVGHVSATTTWTLGTTGTVNGVGDDPTIAAAATGWANTGTGSDPNQLVEVQSLSMWSGGLGINNLDSCSTSPSPCDSNEGSTPEHAIDNNQRYEMVLVDFGTAKVNLSGVTYGWTGNNNYSTSTGSESTVLAYTGSGAPALGGQTWSGLSGWAKIGNYANATVNVLKSTPSAVYSSYWLIGAYNPLAGGSTSGLWAGNDYVKLKNVVGTVQEKVTETKVPEPGSLALIGLAVMSVLYIRRRRSV